MPKNYRIFLVDDDIKTLIMLKSHLEKTVSVPATINVFAYGENCLLKIEEEGIIPDVVVLDYYLNAIRDNAANGVEVLKKIKQVSPSSHVVMMSGQDNMETALETIRHGAADYIIKNEKAMQRLSFIINKIIVQSDNPVIAESGQTDAAAS